jgi:hypothetical protein
LDFRTEAISIAGEKSITKVTFTQNRDATSIDFVVWQFWGRAAEALWIEKSRALFLFPLVVSCRDSRLGCPARAKLGRANLQPDRSGSKPPP